MVAYEGDTDRPVADELAADAGIEVAARLDKGGKSQLDAELPAYNAAAAGSPWLVLRDLDHDAACAPQLIDDLGLVPAEWMCFRVAVREVESWLLADHEGFARYFKVDASRLPVDPDAEPDPKRTLMNVVRGSRRRAIRDAMLPRPGTSVGPLYAATLIEFATTAWSLERAARRSGSLRRARVAMGAMATRWGAATGTT